MNIRIAEEEDLPQIKKLYRDFFSLMASIQPDIIREAEQEEDFFQEMMDSDTSDILVVEADEKIIGFMVLCEQITLPYNCFVQYTYAYLMDIMIQEEYRNKGVAKALIKKAKEWAKSRDLAYLDLNVLARNSNAIQFFKTEGFREQMITMRITL
ncbi:MAG: GNAT family N-acetyltransferase [Bacteroidales bacterium]|nr:GNAT family N-acetyltransferase [Bacteroidales bacterium]